MLSFFKMMQKNAKFFKGSISECEIDIVFESKNHMTGDSLVEFGDIEWDQLILYLGFRYHSRKEIEKKLKT